MKKTLLLYIFLCFFDGKGQIPNPSFEEWVFPAYKVTGWNSYAQFHKQTSNAHEGNYAVEIGMLTYTSAPSDIYNLPLMTGKDYNNPFIPISTRPTKFYGWYVINGGSEIDTLAFIVKLKKLGNLIGVGQFTATSFQFIYTQFSTTINYTSQDLPDSVSITLGFKTNINKYSSCLIDDLSFDQTVGLNEKDILENDIILFPSPTKDKVTISNKNNSSNRIIEIEIENNSNQLLYKKLVEYDDPTIIDLQNFENGLYFFRIRFENGNTTVRKVLKESR